MTSCTSLTRRRDVDRLDVDLHERHVADPGLVLDLDRCRSRARRSDRRSAGSLRCTCRQARSMQPSESGWSSSIMPLAMVVVAKGRLWRSIDRAQQRRGSASAHRARADARRSAAWRRRSARRRARARRPEAPAAAPAAPAPAPRSLVGASATSSGRSRCTGPFGSLSASADGLGQRLADRSLLERAASPW